ncbi:MAG: acetyl-CoA carboxylase, carboxyltransferase subunit beta [Eubacteriales bacterium]
MSIKDLFQKARYISVPQTSRDAAKPPDLPANTVSCPKCSKNVAKDKYEERGRVCPVCGWHARLNAQDRIRVTADTGTFSERYSQLTTMNPLDFDGYMDKIGKLRRATGQNEAVVTGRARIKGYSCLMGVMDTTFLMGSMGSVVGEKLALLFEDGVSEKLPVVLFCASGGARMHEGILSLMQMAKVSAAVYRHSQAGGLFISVLTDPTTGGVTASFASLGDIILVEPEATVGFTGRRVIEGTIGHKLPENFQSAQFNLDHGLVDAIVPRLEMRDTLGRLLGMHR